MQQMNVTDLLQKLIQIPSVNPDNAASSENTGEQAVAEFLRDYLTAQGFDVTLEEVLPGRPNLIARLPGSEGKPRIMLAPHLDTVGVEGMTIPPFSGSISDGKIHGRGSSDTKGPMAAMITALVENKSTLTDLPVAIDFIAFCGEESAQQGSKHFAQHHASDYVFAIAGEPTSLDLVHVTKGSAWITVSSKGKAAHSSQPQLGSNAITSLAKSLLEIDTKLSPHLATFSHPILGHSTLNIGTISGGTRPNIVPDTASAEIDIRTTPALMQHGGGAATLQDFISANQLPLEITRSHENPPMETLPNNPHIQTLLRANPDSKCVGAPWFSDAAHLAAAGIPSICAGPGSIDQAHTKDEFISISDLENGVTFFKNFIIACGGKRGAGSGKHTNKH